MSSFEGERDRRERLERVMYRLLHELQLDWEREREREQRVSILTLVEPFEIGRFSIEEPERLSIEEPEQRERKQREREQREREQREQREREQRELEFRRERERELKREQRERELEFGRELDRELERLERWLEQRESERELEQHKLELERRERHERERELERREHERRELKREWELEQRERDMMKALTSHYDRERGIVMHFTHRRHLMSQHVVGQTGTASACFACGETCKGCPTYGCEECSYFLHESCADMPPKMDHPFHPSHPLFVCVNNYKLKCKLCERSNHGIGFKCLRCLFWLCMKCCTTTGKTVKYTNHEHPLYYVEKSSPKLGQCNGYEAYCKQIVLSNTAELDCTSSLLLQCVECDFVLHMLCGPLPRVIKHECHIDPLVLMDSLIEDESGEYYCDVCETERNPRFRVYRCEGCKFTAHVHCVVSEIAKALKGGLGNVPLTNVGDDLWRSIGQQDATMLINHDKSSMTLQDIIQQLNKDETEKLESRYTWDGSLESEQTATTQVDCFDKDIERTLKLSRLNDENFKVFLDELEDHFWRTRYVLESSDLALAMITVEDCYIPTPLACVLNSLVHKYGNISGSVVRTGWKTVIYFFLCRVLNQMRSTMVQDITLDHLQKWYHQLRFVGWGGFRVGFAFSHFIVLARAFLGAQANRLGDEIPMKIKENIADLNKRIEKKKAELAQIGNEYHGSSPKSDFMKECEKLASELKWKNALEDLFSHPSIE